MKNKHLIFILALLSFYVIPNFVSADVGPKPSADIYVTLSGQKISDVSFDAKMLTCSFEMKYEKIIEELAPYEDLRSDDSLNWHDKCAEIAPKYGFNKGICRGELQFQRGMTNLSKQSRCENDRGCEKLVQKIPDNSRGCYWVPSQFAFGGKCQNSNCDFNYRIPEKFRLAVYLPSQDKVYLSDEVKRENFRSTFNANLFPDGTIILQETTPFIQSDLVRSIKPFFIALALTLILELAVALVFLSIAKIPKHVLVSVLIANIISLPIVWFVFPLLNIIPLAILLGEIFAFVFESYFIYSLNK